MESSIATFLMRWSACELLPTITTTSLHTKLCQPAQVAAAQSGKSDYGRGAPHARCSSRAAPLPSGSLQLSILAEGAIALSVTLSGGALFAS